MLTDSGLMRDPQQHAFSHGGQPMCLYGDPAYPAKGAPLGPFQIWSFNRRNEGIQYSNEYFKVFCGMAIQGHSQLF